MQRDLYITILNKILTLIAYNCSVSSIGVLFGDTCARKCGSGLTPLFGIWATGYEKSASGSEKSAFYLETGSERCPQSMAAGTSHWENKVQDKSHVWPLATSLHLKAAGPDEDIGIRAKIPPF